MTAGLAIRGLVVRDERRVPVVGGVDLDLEPGRVLTLIGETGSGKSLIAQSVMGLLPPGLSAAGTIGIGGEVLRADDAPGLRRLWSRHTMIVPQEPSAALDPTMRLIRQLAETADEPLARAALDAVHLPEEATWAWPHMLSGGMAQRALAAMALLSGAPLLIADEPTKGLDPERVEIAIGLLRALRDRGRALLVITHDLRVARGLGGDVGVVRDGRIVERGEADSVLSRPLHGYTRAWLAADPANWSGRPARPAAAHVPVLRCEAVTFGYAPDRPLAREVSVTLHPGEIIGLSGPSGQGKTTLGNVLLGLHAPASGRVTWIDRTDPYADPIAARRWRRHYQKLHQDPVRAFAPFRTLGRQFSDLRPVLPPGALTDELPVLLERMRVRPALLERKPADVSGGEAQRLAIVRLLLLAPKVIVADEPTSRLDPILQREVVELLVELADERDLGLILISHDAKMVSAIADKLLKL